MASETSQPAEPGNFRTFAIALSAISISAVAGLTVVSVSALNSGPSEAPTFQLVQAATPQAVSQQHLPVTQPAPAVQQPQMAAVLPPVPNVAGPSVEEMVRQAREAAAAAGGQQPAPQQVAQAEPTGPTLVQLLSHPEAGPAILESLKLAAGIDVPGENDSGTPIFAFFDPRCPHCHAAYEELNGKFRIKWLPTLALGTTPEGEAIIANLLGGTEAGMDQGRMVSVTLTEDPERLQRLDDVFKNELEATGNINDAQRFVIDDNLQIALQLFERHDQPFGVPTFIIPKADGTAVMARGWDRGGETVEIITEAYGS